MKLKLNVVKGSMVSKKNVKLGLTYKMDTDQRFYLLHQLVREPMRC